MFNINIYKTTAGDYNYQSMSGGKFNIPPEKINEFYEFSLNHPEFCLCEKLSNVFSLYFDIDEFSSEIFKNIDELLCSLISNLKDFFVLDEENIKYILLNNKIKTNNYHIYFPDIIVNQIISRRLCYILNEDYEQKIFDSNAYNSCIRIYGSGKYDKKNKIPLDEKSIYIFNNSNVENILKKNTNILKCTSIRRNSEHKLTKLSAQFTKLLEIMNTENTSKIITNKKIKSEDDDEIKMSKREHYYHNELTRNNNHILNLIMFNCLGKYRVEDYKEWIKVIFIFL
jgi:hypothetical protein